MLSVQTIRRQLLQSLEAFLLPSFQAERPPKLVLAQVPLRLPEGVSVSHLPLPPLEDKPSGTQQEWRGAGVNSSPLPTLIILFDGRGDMRIGATDRMIREAGAEGEWAQSGCHVLHFSRPTCLVIPPNTPYSDGALPHWERSESPPLCRLLWIREVPRGVLCHICTTERGVHKAEHSLMVQDEDISALNALLIKELSRQGQSSEIIAHSYLKTVLLCVQRCLLRDPPVLANTVHLPPPEPVSSGRPTSADRIIRAADEFVQKYLREPITLPEIAEHCGVSATHLNRVFNAQLGISAKRFIYLQRIRSAQVILTESDVPVKEVATLVGFSRSSHFCRVFQRTVGMSPTEFRANASGRK